MADPPLDPKLQRLVQLAVAFGQGTGSVHLTAEGASAGAQVFTDYLGPALVQWDTLASLAWDFARVTGHLASHNAVKNGRHAITAEDVLWAANAVANGEVSEFSCGCRRT